MSDSADGKCLDVLFTMRIGTLDEIFANIDSQLVSLLDEKVIKACEVQVTKDDLRAEMNR